MKKICFLLCGIFSALYAGSDIPTFNTYEQESKTMQDESIREWQQSARENNPGFDALPKEQQNKLVYQEGLAAMERTRPDIEAYRDYAEKYGTPQEKEEARTAIANLERMQEGLRTGKFGGDFDRAAADLDTQMRKDFAEEKKATQAQPERTPVADADSGVRAQQRAEIQKEIDALKRQRAQDPLIKAGYNSSPQLDDKIYAAQERLDALDRPTTPTASPETRPVGVQSSPGVSDDKAQQAVQRASLDKEIEDLKRQQSAERASGFASTTTDNALADAQEKRAALDAQASVAPTPDKSPAVQTDASDSVKPVAAAAPVQQKKTSLTGLDWDKLDADAKAAQDRADQKAAFDKQITDLKAQKASGTSAADVRPGATSSVTSEITETKKPTSLSGFDFDRVDAEEKEATKKVGYFRRKAAERQEAQQASINAQKTSLDNEIKTLTEQRKKIADAYGRDSNDPTLKTQYDDKLSTAIDKRQALDAPAEKKPGILQRAKQSIAQKVAQFQLSRAQAKTAALEKAAARPSQADAGSQTYYNQKIRENKAREAALAQKAKVATPPKSPVHRPVPITRY